MNVLENDLKFATPASRLKNRQLGVIGNYKNFTTGGVYRHVARHCGFDVRPADEVDVAPIGFILWMNGVLGDGWGWTAEKVAYDIESVQTRWPNAKIIGDPTFRDDKLVVEQNFATVFGYELKIDPTSYVGRAVKKSRIQARHDGQVITCPVEEIDPMACYERLIDNTVNGEYVKDIRAVILNGSIPFCYVKYRAIDTRFSNTNAKAFLVSPCDVFSKDEIEEILGFSALSGLDLGEVDILRNNADGKIYIVDANNTPSGPPNGISIIESSLAIRLLSSALLRTLE